MKANVLLGETIHDINRHVVVFLDDNKTEYFLDEELVPAKGFGRQMFDILYAETKPFTIEYKVIDGKNYITQLHY